MFRMLKLNPPHGWRAVAWELAIVTAGVLIALGVQQWAEERNWQGQRPTRRSPRSATNCPTIIRSRSNGGPIIRASMRNSIGYSGGCWRAARRWTRHRSIPTRSSFRGALSRPRSIAMWLGKERSPKGPAPASTGDAPCAWVLLYPAWMGAGISVGIEPGRAGTDDAGATVPLDPMTRLTLLQRIQQLRGRAQFMDRRAGNLLDHIQRWEWCRHHRRPSS